MIQKMIKMMVLGGVVGMGSLQAQFPEFTLADITEMANMKPLVREGVSYSISQSAADLKAALPCFFDVGASKRLQRVTLLSPSKLSSEKEVSYTYTTLMGASIRFVVKGVPVDAWDLGNPALYESRVIEAMARAPLNTQPITTEMTDKLLNKFIPAHGWGVCSLSFVVLPPVELAEEVDPSQGEDPAGELDFLLEENSLEPPLRERLPSLDRSMTHLLPLVNRVEWGTLYSLLVIHAGAPYHLHFTGWTSVKMPPIQAFSEAVRSILKENHYPDPTEVYLGFLSVDNVQDSAHALLRALQLILKHEGISFLNKLSFSELLPKALSLPWLPFGTKGAAEKARQDENSVLAASLRLALDTLASRGHAVHVSST